MFPVIMTSKLGCRNRSSCLIKSSNGTDVRGVTPG